ESEGVQASRKEQGAGSEEPAGPGSKRPGPAGRRPSNRDERERVIHLVAGRGLEDRQQVGRQPRPESVSAKRPGRDGDEAGDRAQRKKHPIHYCRSAGTSQCPPSTTKIAPVIHSAAGLAK